MKNKIQRKAQLFGAAGDGLAGASGSDIILNSKQQLNDNKQNSSCNTQEDYPYWLLIPIITGILICVIF